MILESIFSWFNLSLTCGSSVYVLIKHSRVRYSKLLARFTYACAGIVMIGSRSLIVLIYKLAFKEYMFDPVLIEMEEEKSRGKLNILDEILGTLSMAGLIYSLYSCHGYYVLGICVVTSLSILDVVKLRRMAANKSQSRNSYESRVNVFTWAILSCYFAYVVGNNYAIVATYPLLLTNWALAPEGFYQEWTIRRSINDYLMATYVVCMTEAIRQANVS
ncbi:uncharacterized protein LOC143430369 [Xylocopa sonorina]|uniref:uncharacterized protein LOC143430369 n=1 Tax=Xylocopa sonorina TaxID=1818115 RepID=UPI00403B24B2